MSARNVPEWPLSVTGLGAAEKRAIAGMRMLRNGHDNMSASSIRYTYVSIKYNYRNNFRKIRPQRFPRFGRGEKRQALLFCPDAACYR
jgi:hypothetical protein